MNSLKGVNKQIIEINYTRDDYVQKAILIINPDKCKQSKQTVNQKAFDYMSSLELPQTPKKKPISLSMMQAGISLLLGAGISALLFQLF